MGVKYVCTVILSSADDSRSCASGVGSIGSLIYMVGSILVGLQASFPDGREVAAGDFLVPLQIRPVDEVEATRADGGEWAAGMIYFPVTRLSAFVHEAEPHEVFAKELRRALLVAAAFLDRRPTTVLDELRSTGLALRLFIDVRMDQDQMELNLPHELVAACGRHQLGVFVISNDIAADEILIPS
jgi:hypothetical protein